METRYIPHRGSLTVDLDQAKQDISRALLRNVHRVHKYYTSHSHPDGRVYTGISGIALMNIYLSDLSLSSISMFPSTSRLLSRSDKYLCAALTTSPRMLSRPRDASHTAFLDTSVGPATLLLLSYLRDSQAGSLSKSFLETQKIISDACPASIEVLRSAIEHAVASDPESKSTSEIDNGSEVLYGRAGLLYAVLYLRSSLAYWNPSYPTEKSVKIMMALRPLISDEVVGQLVESIIRQGKNGSTAYAAEITSESAPPLMWSWHGKRYLGGAHGVAGILQMLLSCPANIIAPYIPNILGTVEWVLACQNAQGNWPTKAPPAAAYSSRGFTKAGSSIVREDELVHWCHGAPSFLILLSTVLKNASNSAHPLTLSKLLHEEIVASLRRGADIVYEKGFLRKGVGLCHGVAGSVYALLAVSDVLDSTSAELDYETSASTATTAATTTSRRPPDRYLLRAMHLAHLATAFESLTADSGEMATPDHPWSLYEGVGGMCCAWGEVLRKFREGSGENNGGRGMPGYTDIVFLNP